jgi:hypothetical protein
MPQAAELDLAPWAGGVPVDLFGSCAFMSIREQPHPVMLTGHSFYWFKLLPGAAARRKAPLDATDRPELPPADRPLRRRALGCGLRHALGAVLMAPPQTAPRRKAFVRTGRTGTGWPGANPSR